MPRWKKLAAALLIGLAGVTTLAACGTPQGCYETDDDD